MSKATRSPLKDKPLRLPGQSLQEQRQKLLEDKLENWLLLALFFAVFAAFEWLRLWLPMQHSPWLFSAFAGGLCAFATWRFFRLKPQLRALRQGIDGERAVGQYLERLREQGYQVFHDVLADGFNIDHVLVGPAGVLTVETKTWSKPIKGDARIRFDGEHLKIGNLQPDRDPLLQARLQARWLKTLLQESTGRVLDVQPVLVFPGWFVEAAPGSQSPVWVMEPKGLPAFLAREPNRLDPPDVKLVAFHLSRYVRHREQAA